MICIRSIPSQYFYQPVLHSSVVGVKMARVATVIKIDGHQWLRVETQYAKSILVGGSQHDGVDFVYGCASGGRKREVH